jgi:hypothetical protein
VRGDNALLRSPGIISGVMFFRKCTASMRLVRQWRQLYSDDFHLFDDTPSRSPNYPEFIEHRHDQAGLSILCRQKRVTTISAYELWYPSDRQGSNGKWGENWGALMAYPIQARRDKRRSFIARQRSSFRKKFTTLRQWITSLSHHMLRNKGAVPPMLLTPRKGSDAPSSNEAVDRPRTHPPDRAGP